MLRARGRAGRGSVRFLPAARPAPRPRDRSRSRSPSRSPPGGRRRRRGAITLPAPGSWAKRGASKRSRMARSYVLSGSRRARSCATSIWTWRMYASMVAVSVVITSRATTAKRQSASASTVRSRDQSVLYPSQVNAAIQTARRANFESHALERTMILQLF